MSWEEQWTGSNGSAWPSYWTQAGNTGSVQDIQSNRGRMATGSTAFNSGRWTQSNDDVSGGHPWLYNMDAIVRVNFQNPKVTQYPLMGVRSSGAVSGTYPTTGYFCEIEVNGNQYTLRKVVSNTVTTLQTISKTFTAGTDIYLRIQAIGTTVQCRIWNVGSAEPTSWDASTTDSAITGTGGVYLSSQSGINAVCTANYDELYVSDMRLWTPQNRPVITSVGSWI